MGTAYRREVRTGSAPVRLYLPYPLVENGRNVGGVSIASPSLRFCPPAISSGRWHRSTRARCMNASGNRSKPSSSDQSTGKDGDDQALPGIIILIGLAILAAVCVAGYFLLMKLVDISREEDCALAGRRNCARIELPSYR
jgi:hypothetical protein